MALKYADRVKESTVTTGTGTLTLGGAETGFRSFAAIGDGNQCVYCIDSGGSDWEVGIGTYTASGTTLSRTTVIASSNSGSLVSFGAGIKIVFVTSSAAYVPQLVLVERKYVSTAVSSLTFDNIPDYFEDLVVSFHGRDTNSGTYWGDAFVKLNNDSTASNYGYRNYNGLTNGTWFGGSSAPTSQGVPMFTCPGTSGNANAVGGGELIVFGYSGSLCKNMTAFCQTFRSSDVVQITNGSVYKQTDAITRLDLTCEHTNFDVGTTAVVYGRGWKA